MTFIFVALVICIPMVLSWPFGWWMAAVMNPAGSLEKRRGWLEGIFLKIAGKDAQTWKGYTISMLLFNLVMFVVTFTILSLQQYLPLNPDGKAAFEPSLIFNTVASFVTNTDLQHYTGEASLSYFSQIFGLMWLQFVCAATGISVLAALSRGLSGKVKMGNFYIDILRSTFLILLPMAFVTAIILMAGGVPMTFKGSVSAKTLEGAVQTITRGPVAALVAIKQIGTNGGGFFGQNSAHPFENPTFFTNIIECMGIILLPMASVWMFGRITGRLRHAAVIFAVMAVLLFGAIALSIYYESAPAQALKGLPVTTTGNLEGKELRFGFVAGPLWAAVTTCTSNGSVNCMHDSLNPMTGLVALTGMWLNAVFGGIGVGMINMFMYIVVGVFICGMMIGRTPEYLSKKVETREMKLALLGLLSHPLFILGGTALFVTMPWGTAAILNPGSHGFTEVLYEFTSASANNGSNFAGLTYTPVWNIATGAIMLLARFIPIILPLSIAGSLAGKKYITETAGTLKTDTPLFGIVILGSIILIGALLFMPAAAIGPVAEYLNN